MDFVLMIFALNCTAQIRFKLYIDLHLDYHHLLVKFSFKNTKINNSLNLRNEYPFLYLN